MEGNNEKHDRQQRDTSKPRPQPALARIGADLQVGQLLFILFARRRRVLLWQPQLLELLRKNVCWNVVLCRIRHDEPAVRETVVDVRTKVQNEGRVERDSMCSECALFQQTKGSTQRES